MILGINGYARSGKDTLFTALKKMDDRFQRAAFADDMKTACTNMLNGPGAAGTTQSLIRTIYGACLDNNGKEAATAIRRLMLEQACTDDQAFFQHLTLSDADCSRLVPVWKLVQDELPTSQGAPLYSLNFHDEATKDQHRWFIISIAEAMRALDPDFWARKALKRAHAIEARGGIVVFTDLRFKHEAGVLRDNGALSIRVDCDEKELLRRGWNPDTKDHPSEAELLDYDFDARIDSTSTPAVTLAEQTLGFLFPEQSAA